MNRQLAEPAVNNLQFTQHATDSHLGRDVLLALDRQLAPKGSGLLMNLLKPTQSAASTQQATIASISFQREN